MHSTCCAALGAITSTAGGSAPATAAANDDAAATRTAITSSVAIPTDDEVAVISAIGAGSITGVLADDHDGAREPAGALVAVADSKEFSVTFVVVR